MNNETKESKEEKLKAKTLYGILSSIDIKPYVEDKVVNGVNLSYLSWAKVWGLAKENNLDISYRVERFTNDLPYVFDPNTGYMVFTEVTINDTTYPMHLPVMNSANKAMLNVPYEYEVKGGKTKKVEKATMTDINKTIMRCLAKNFSLFGLGLSLYIGEDLPEMTFIPTEDELKLKQKSIIDKVASLGGKENKLLIEKIIDIAKTNNPMKVKDMDVLERLEVMLNTEIVVDRKKGDSKDDKSQK